MARLALTYVHACIAGPESSQVDSYPSNSLSSDPPSYSSEDEELSELSLYSNYFALASYGRNLTENSSLGYKPGTGHSDSLPSR